MSKQAQPRVWEIQRFDPETGEELLTEQEFRQAVADALIEVETIGHRVGGSFLSVPKRVQVAPDIWVTWSWRILWQSFAPGSRAQPVQQPVQEASPEELEALEEPLPDAAP